MDNETSSKLVNGKDVGGGEPNSRYDLRPPSIVNMMEDVCEMILDIRALKRTDGILSALLLMSCTYDQSYTDEEQFDRAFARTYTVAQHSRPDPVMMATRCSAIR